MREQQSVRPAPPRRMSAKQMNSSLLSGIFNGCNGVERVSSPVMFTQICRWHVAVDILLAVRRLVVQGGSTTLEQLTKKPGFFC